VSFFEGDYGFGDVAARKDGDIFFVSAGVALSFCGYAVAFCVCVVVVWVVPDGGADFSYAELDFEVGVVIHGVSPGSSLAVWRVVHFRLQDVHRRILTFSFFRFL